MISVALARRQHRRYVELLRSSSLSVEVLPPDESFPDCPFVEDQAVVAGGRALITRPGHPSRRGEAMAVEAALRPTVEIHQMRAPARLDGGDVLRIGRTFAVGVGARTNRAGFEALEVTFAPLGFEVVAIPLPEGPLHLKSVCTGVSGDTIILADGTLEPATFEGIAEVIVIPQCEAYGANVLRLPGRVAVSDGFPSVRAELEDRGIEAIPLQMSEFRKADGALTCLSILY